LQLADLKGKVVAVHFYAFQCINCRRNLPHYNTWFSDYEDQGLVVIGIQTPETAAERSAEKVAAAMEAEGIRYPVLMDGQSTNWQAWANTMWPTVYLIDKRGYLRRWWQGELNWKDTPGEQQMRQTIEQLLAETD
jgi:peroxiredoxin